MLGREKSFLIPVHYCEAGVQAESFVALQANMGKLDSRGSRWIVIVSNLALVQVQAIVVAFLASSFAIILAWIPKGQVTKFCCHFVYRFSI